MAPKKPQLVAEAVARQIMALPKTATPQTEWREDRNHSGIKIINFGVRSDVMRNLIVELTVRAHPRVNRTTIELGLFTVDPIYRQQERVYQLAIDDPLFKTHIEPGKPAIYGSHELIGDLTIELQQCNNYSFHQALELFSERVNLTLDEGPIDDPFGLKLK
jgi:hypothetical protein